MSFVYSHPFTGLANGLNTINGGGGGVGGWVELGRTTLGSSGDNITVSSLADKRYYMVLCNTIPTGNVDFAWRSGNGSVDTGNNYASRSSSDGGTPDATSTSANRIRAGLGGTINTPQFHMGYWANLSGNEKLFVGHSVGQNAAGSGTAPSRRENTGKWVNTSNPLDSLTGYNNGAGSHDTNSELVVLGWDPDDTHTNNFWEELASATGSAVNELSSGTFTSKKYLWLQCHILNNSGSQGATLELGNGTVDTGNNYSARWNPNGTSDSTHTSKDYINMAGNNVNSAGGAHYISAFIVNNSSNEKLVTGHTISAQAPAATDVPKRAEFTGKWTNTSNQVDILKVVDTVATGNADFTLKVWGSD